MSLYNQITSNIELWKKAYDSRYNSFQDYLMIAFNDENSIWVNDIDKVDSAQFVIVIIKFKEPYIACDNRTWNNGRFKIFHFVKHEYGDFYEMSYLPICDGWKIYFHIPLWNHQAVLDSWQVENIDTQSDKLEVDILRDFKKGKTFEVDVNQIKQTLIKCLNYIHKNCKTNKN